MSPSVVHIGVDVSKDSLEVCFPDHTRQTWPNTRAGCRSLLKSLPSEGRVLCEATGGYEQLLVTESLQAARPVIRVNPKRVRDFARSQGWLAKTDAIDARVLAEYGRVTQPRVVELTPAYQGQLRALIQRRDQLVEIMGAEKHRLAQEPIPEVRSSHRTLLASLERHLQRVEKALDQLTSVHADLAERAATLERFQGVGRITALAVLAYLPELGSLNRNRAASLAGLAPFNRDSGRFRGQRRICGGRFPLRRHLYMPAVVAARWNPVLRPFYQHLLSSGKPPKLALTALMRKLLIALNGALKEPNSTSP